MERFYHKPPLTIKRWSAAPRRKGGEFVEHSLSIIRYCVVFISRWFPLLRVVGARRTSVQKVGFRSKSKDSLIGLSKYCSVSIVHSSVSTVQ